MKKLGRKKVLSKTELKIFLNNKGIRVRPSYCHEDYMFTSFTMPYPLKDKLTRICTQYGITRSSFVQMLIDNFNDEDYV